MTNILLIIFLLEWTQIKEVLNIVGLPALISAVVIFLLKWKRFKPNDDAVVNMKNAETEKLKAEAAEIKAKADVTIVDSAFKLIQRLSDECDMTKKQLEKTQASLDSAEASLRDALNTITEIKNELSAEKDKNGVMAQKIIELTEELNKLKSSKNAQP